jgi:hypothetical protein
VEKLADSRVPVHTPERSANGPMGVVGDGVVAVEPEVDPEVEPHALATQARTNTPTKRMRLRTTEYEHRPRPIERF